MNRSMPRILFLLALLVLSACSTKTSQMVSSMLWGDWEDYDQQVQVDYPDAVPIILIHGWNGGEFSWPAPRKLMAMEQTLQRDVFLFTYRTGVVANRYPPIELLEEQLDIYLKNYQQVDVIAHSMGGLLLRQYLAEHSDNPIRRILFLSTPHFGSNVANLLVELGNIAYSGNIQAEELLPGSDFLWQLNSLNGAELDGKQVLNVYARKQHNLLKGDLIVTTAHAWLPWVRNAEVDGDHHLGLRIGEPWVLNFLRTGEPLLAAPVPDSREIWLKFKVPDSDEPASLNATSVYRFGAKNTTKALQYGLCCDGRSGLHPVGGTTMIIDHAMPGDRIQFYPRKGAASQQIYVDQLMQHDWPVQMRMLEFNMATQHPTGEPRMDADQRE